MSVAYVARINRYVERLFNIKGSPTITDIEPALAVQAQLIQSAEEAYAQGWDKFGMAVAVPAAVGFVGGVRMRNPAGSNVVAVPTKVTAWLGATGQINLTISNTITTDLTTGVTTGIKMDRRTLRSNSTVIISNQNTTATITTGGIIGIANPIGNTEEVFIRGGADDAPVILPGDSLDVIANIANTLLLVSMQWRERSLELSEFN